MKKTERPSADTRERVLDVAERLFSERGLDAVSIRDIIGGAEVNLGAVNYHFGSKENLISAVFQRRMAPLTEQRFRALDLAEKTAGDKPPKLEAVLEAVFRPAIEQSMDVKGGAGVFSKLMARCFLDPHPAVEAAIRANFEPVVKRFDAALLRIMPHLSPEEVFWRMHLLVGALHHSLMMQGRTLPDGRRLCMDVETYVNRFVAFAAAGFRASLPSAQKKRPSTP